MPVPVRVSDRYYNNGGGPNRPIRNKSAIGVILILLALVFSGIPSKIYNDITIYRHEKIKNYLDQREQYFSSSDQQFKQLLNKLNQAKSSNIIPFLPDIQQAKVVINNNYHSFNELKPPRAFKELHTETIQWYIEKNSAIDYLEVAAISNSYQPNTFNVYVNKGNQTLSNINPKFIQGLQKSKLEYQINADGSIVYWIKSNYGKEF